METAPASRVESLQERLREAGVDVAVVIDPTNRLYLTGSGTAGTLVVPARENPVHLVRINVQRGRADSRIDDVRPSAGFSSVLETIDEVCAADAPTIGLELDVLPAEHYLSYRSQFAEDDIVDVAPEILALRERKSEAELERIEAGAEISRAVLEAVPRVFEPGMTELELQAELERVKRAAGGENGMGFRAWDQLMNFGVVVSGPNTATVSGYWLSMTGSGPSAVQPYGAGHREITDGDVIVVDHGTVHRGYHSDEARTYVVGEATAEQREIHGVLEDAMDAAVDELRPGTPIGAVYRAAESVAAAAGYADRFMVPEAYDVSFLGHMVGLEIDEEPLITPQSERAIEPGMVFALEPKIMLEGYGLDLEDTYAVTEDGPRRLTSTPRRLVEL